MAKFSFGNIIGKATDFLDENVASGINTLGNGLYTAGHKVLSESLASITGQLPNSAYDSPVPLGMEWDVDPAYQVTLMFTDPNTKAPGFVSGYMPDTISMGLTADYDSPLESVAESLSSGGVGLAARLFGYKVSANMFSMVLWSGSSHMDLELELRFVALQDTKTDVIDNIRKLYSLITPSIESFSVTQSPVQLGMVTSPGPSLEYAGDPSDIGALFGTVMQAGEVAVGGAVDALGGAVTGVVDGSSTVGAGIIAGASGTAQALGAGFNTLVKNLRVKNNISLKLGEFAIMESVVIKGVTPAYNVKSDFQGNWIDATVSVSIGTFVSPTNLDIPKLVGIKSGGAPTDMGASTTVNPLQGIATPPFIGNGNVFNTPSASGSSLFPKLTATVMNPIKVIKTAILGDSSKLGKDAGLGHKYLDVIHDNTKQPNAPGLSASDIVDFSKKFI